MRRQRHSMNVCSPSRWNINHEVDYELSGYFKWQYISLSKPVCLFNARYEASSSHLRLWSRMYTDTSKVHKPLFTWPEVFLRATTPQHSRLFESRGGFEWRRKHVILRNRRFWLLGIQPKCSARIQLCSQVPVASERSEMFAPVICDDSIVRMHFEAFYCLFSCWGKLWAQGHSVHTNYSSRKRNALAEQKYNLL